MMDLILTRFRIDQDGAFSYLKDDQGNQVCVTGSHSFLQPDGQTWAPVTPPGVYQCVRGKHTIENPTPTDPENLTTFETFEITGVAGHTGVLFHFGNWPKSQSKGCELMGMSFGILAGLEAVEQSVIAFNKFMLLQSGVDTFELTVE